MCAICGFLSLARGVWSVVPIELKWDGAVDSGTFRDGGVEPNTQIGALGLVASHRPAVFDHLAVGEYEISAWIDGVRAESQSITVRDDTDPIVVKISKLEHTRIDFAIESGQLPSRLLVQCPPAPSQSSYVDHNAWCEAYAQWLAHAIVRDRIDPEFAIRASTHHFSRPHNDFAVGWHYWRSLVVRNAKLEGQLHVGSSGRATMEIPVIVDPTEIVRITAEGYEPIEMRFAELNEYENGAVPLYFK